jgi:hypothetical protein
LTWPHRGQGSFRPLQWPEWAEATAGTASQHLKHRDVTVHYHGTCFTQLSLNFKMVFALNCIKSCEDKFGPCEHGCLLGRSAV